MNYLKDYNILKKIYNETDGEIKIPGSEIVIYNNKFESNGNDIYPDRNEYEKKYNENKLRINLIAGEKNIKCENTEKIFDFIDPLVIENNSFIYPLYINRQKGKVKSVIILLHGLNEKSWDKYHTWAKKLVELTGKAVLMFPISFHINRTPADWNDARKMNAVSKERKKIFPDIIETSFVNAAISTRLQFAPQTFFWSGLRTYNDIHKLIKQIRSNDNEYIEKDATLDFFSYSIGAFLTEILFLSDTDGIFNNSRAFLFCGGPTMDAMYPVSKYIYDNKTEVEMISFYVNNFDESIKRNNDLQRYFRNSVSAGNAFKSMLNKNYLTEFREEYFNRFYKNIFALALEKDFVIPPLSVRKTLKGRENNIPVNVMTLDFPYEYDHVSPFPLIENIQKEVDISFNRVFEIAGDYLI
jgi:hypothetical protein